MMIVKSLKTYFLTVVFFSWFVNCDVDGRQPRPVGIDFAPGCAYAVYAEDVAHFTRLAMAVPEKPENWYAEYMKQLYDGATLDEETPVPWPYRLYDWFRCIFIGNSNRDCRKCADRLRSRISHSGLSKSNEPVYEQLRSQNTMELRSNCHDSLQNWLAGWWKQETCRYRDPMTRCNLLLSTVDLLEQLKKTSLREHNITLTSSIVSRPSWAEDLFGDILEEAFRLTGIELLEPPKLRADMAAMIAPLASQSGHVLVIDHGQYYLDYHLIPLNLDESTTSRREELGLDRIVGGLGQQMAKDFDEKHPEKNRKWWKMESWENLTRAAYTARLKIKDGCNWEDDQPLDERSVPVMIIDYEGMTRDLVLTGNALEKREIEFTESVRKTFDIFLYDHEARLEYWENLPPLDSWVRPEPLDDLWLAHEHYHDYDAWFRPVDAVVIIDGSLSYDLLADAVGSVMKRDIKTGLIANRTFGPDMAARGAALKALELVRGQSTCHAHKELR